MENKQSTLHEVFEKFYKNSTKSQGNFAIELIKFLREIHKRRAEIDGYLADRETSSLTPEIHRVVTIIGERLFCPETVLGEDSFLRLFSLSQILNNIFAASSEGGVDELLKNNGIVSRESIAKVAVMDRQKFLKTLIIFSLDSHIDIDFEWLIKAEPRLASILYLKLVSSRPITTVMGHDKKEKLLEIGYAIKPFIPSDTDYLILLSNAWLQSSYGFSQKKHEIKSVLNSYIREWLQKIGCVDVEISNKRQIKECPRIVVAAEVMHSSHVQYRYFGQYIRQLSKRFELILVTEVGQVDDDVRGLFDEVYTFARGLNPKYLNEVRERIVDAKPDMIFWPSVGLRHWGTALANLRLAPLQFTALGHSASTFSKQIDYYLTEAGYVSDSRLFSERLLLLPDNSLIFERPSKMPRPRPRPNLTEDQPVIKIALPSNLLKMNPRFIEALKEISSKVDAPVSFFVFPNVSGVEYISTRKVMESALGSVTVFPILPYQRYIERLSECQINLSPFPFGGLHSVIDSLSVGVPVIALEGHEPHSRTDSMLLRRLGMPDCTITYTVDEYVKIAVKAINDLPFRTWLRRKAIDLNVGERMFGDEQTPLRNEVLECVGWMYANHEKLSQSARRVYNHADWTQ